MPAFICVITVLSKYASFFNISFLSYTFWSISILGAALGDLRLRGVELGAGVGQLGVDEFQQAGVHFVYLILIQLHLHHLFDEAVDVYKRQALADPSEIVSLTAF